MKESVFHLTVILTELRNKHISSSNISKINLHPYEVFSNNEIYVFGQLFIDSFIDHYHGLKLENNCTFFLAKKICFC